MVCKICSATIPEGTEFCPNCGAKIEKKVQDIPLEEAPEKPFEEFDPEDGTTVLTDGMSGTLVSDQFVKKPREHQPQSPEGKVVTPAPVTGSSILSDTNVAPAQQPQGQPVQPAPANPQGMPQGMPPQGMPQAMQQPQGMPQAMQQPQGAPQVMQPQGAPQVMQPQGMPRPVPMAQPQSGDPTVSGVGYFGYMLLFSIPLIGLIFAIVFAVSHKNKNVKNFAIGWLLFVIVVSVLSAVSLVILRSMGVSYVENLLDF